MESLQNENLNHEGLLFNRNCFGREQKLKKKNLRFSDQILCDIDHMTGCTRIMARGVEGLPHGLLKRCFSV